MDQPGAFVISLDFELYWGVRDKRRIEDYRAHLDGVSDAVDKLLALFAEYDIHATWATLGFLYFEDRAQLIAGLPSRRPQYRDARLSPYDYIDGNPALQPRYHFAPRLIERIARTPGQELATHTFSHYYCLEPGQTADDFREDLRMAVAIARQHGHATRSLVFPRNQYNPAYLSVLADHGILAYRGNEHGYLYDAVAQAGQNPLRRALRLADAYVNLSGHHTYRWERLRAERPYNIPSSRYLRPYRPRTAWLEPLLRRRIVAGLRHAARRGELYHLWWHPHNFGADPGINIASLRRILDRFQALRERDGMRSMNMGEVAVRLEQGHDG